MNTNTLSATRLRQYEHLLRRLRADARLDTDPRVIRLIEHAKRRCMPSWDSQAENHRAKAAEKMAFRWL